jgi:UDP-glucose 4-epimerase
LKAIVTGANGFVGAAVVRAAAAARIEAIPVTRATTDYSPRAIAALIRESGSSAIFHAAGSASVGASFERPDEDFADSVGLFERVLEGARLSGARPLIVYPSTAAVYGNAERQPISEAAPVDPISPYGTNKAACEALARKYAEESGVPALVLRIFSLIGEAQRRLLVWEIFRQYRDAPEVVLAGTGEEERDYLHVDDCAQYAWRCAARRTAPYEVLNMASGRSVRVRDLASRIGALLGSNKPVRALGKRLSGDPRVWRADVSKLHAMVGGAAAVDFDARLEQVVAAWAG